MMQVKKKTLLCALTALLLCAALCLGLAAGKTQARADETPAEKQVQIGTMGGVTYDGAKLSFIMEFDKSVQMFDGDYNYVAVGAKADWSDEWFSQPSLNSVTKGGDENTPGTSRYVITHLNDVIGQYVYINGVSVRDIMLSAVAYKSSKNPKEADHNAKYTAAWLATDIRVSKEGNHINFFGIDTSTPFVASLLGADADAKKLTKPLTVTVHKGYTAMDGSVAKKSMSVTYTDGAWGAPVEVVAADLTNNVTVGGISAPCYDTAVNEKILYGTGGVSFSAFFSEENAWYDADVTNGYGTDLKWYWSVNAPESELEWVRVDGNGGGTTAEAVTAVMQRLGKSVREKITFADADGENEKTLGEISDSQTLASGKNGAKYAKFNVLANIRDNSLIFMISSDIAELQTLLGWKDGAIGRDFKITFKKGFATMMGKTIAEDISFVYRTATGVFERDGISIPPEAPEKPITTPVTVSMSLFHGYNDDKQQSVGYQIHFSENIRPRDVGNVNVAGEQWVQEGFILNGKTFGELYDYAQAQDPKLDFRVMFEGANFVTVWVDKRIPEEMGGLLKEEDGSCAAKGNRVTVKADVALPREAKLAYDDDQVFENSGGNWTKAYVFPDREFGSVDISGISNPVLYEDGKVKYTVTFAEDVATKQYFHANADVDWLIAVNAGGGLNNLSEEELKRLEFYGILSSLTDKIVISVNGVAKTVGDWMRSDENPSNYNQGVLMLHYGQDNDANGLQILWNSKRIGEGETQPTESQPLCPSLDAKISITFKKGFRTPAFQELEQDVTFTYSGEAGARFVRESGTVVYDTVTFTKVFYNGERIQKDGTLTLPAGTFTLDKNLFTVLFAEGDIAYTVTGGDSMQAGNNTVTITATSGEATETFTFTAVCSAKQSGGGKKSGCGSVAAASGVLSAMALLGAAAVSLAAKKRGNIQ